MRTTLILLLAFLFVFQGSHAQYIPVPSASSISLNGTWKFNPSPGINSFSSTRYQSSWKDIKVPGEWTMQGFDVGKGTRAAYQTRFVIPREWNGKSVILRFDAVYSDAIVWLNGNRICSHVGGFNVFECDISSFLTKGSNLLTVGVMNESIADSLSCGSQYAAHPLGGIPRKVTLFCVPSLHISDLFIGTTFDEKFENSTLQLDLIFNNGKLIPADGELKLDLYAPDGTLALTKSQRISVSGVRNWPVQVKADVKKPLKWNAEYPNLYRLVLSFSSAYGNETIEKKIGFRQLVVAGNQLFLNGSPLKLHGVDRHEVHPLSGRCLNIDLWRKDASLYKEANVNYIRTSHYPPAEEFIDLCDSIGLYVELENPLVWIGHGANQKLDVKEAWDLRIRNELIKTTRETITFYRDHPAIIIWSLANESAWTDNWHATKDSADIFDPTRPKSFHDQAYGAYNNYGSVVMQIANVHYPGPQGPDIADTFPRPLLFGEYCHLNTYNRQEIATDPGVREAWGAGFHRMWEKMYRSKGCLGGAIWSGIDDAFMLPDGRLVGYGEWGPVDGWRRMKPEYYHIMKTYSPVIIGNKKAIPDEKGVINLQVENRFDFTDLKDCRFEWEIGSEKGNVSINAAPHNSAVLKVGPFRENIRGKLLTVRVYSPYNRLIDESVVEIGVVNHDYFPFTSLPKQRVTKSENGSMITITSGDAEWIFDREKGRLALATMKGDTVLSGGAGLMVLPLHSEECKTEHSLNIPFINSSCTDWNAKSVNVLQSDDTVKISVEGTYLEADVTVDYCFTEGGELLMKYSFTASREVNPRQVGLVFTVPGSQKNLSWYRKGYWSTYPDWDIGRTSGKAVPFPDEAYFPGKPWRAPVGLWKYDANALGTSDFRSTKSDIYWASLTHNDGNGIVAVSGGKQAFRAWADGRQICFLVADYSNSGAEIFFSSHTESERKPLHKGDKFTGSVRLKLATSR